MGQIKKIRQLVIDSGALLKNVPIWEYGEEFYSIKEVFHEIRDKQAKEFINSLPVEIKFIEPRAATIKFVSDFTKKTGDFASLSLTDTKVLALTYELEVEAKGGSDHLRSEPVQNKPEVSSSKPPPQEQLPGWYWPKSDRRSSSNSRVSHNQMNSMQKIEATINTIKINDESNTGQQSYNNNNNNNNNEDIKGDKNKDGNDDSGGWIKISSRKGRKRKQNSVCESDYNDVEVSSVSSDFEVEDDMEEMECNTSTVEITESIENVNGDEGSDSDDDDEGWITPSNVHEILRNHNSLGEEDYKDVEVACITGDFAMQNSLLHMGLNTVGVDGKLVKSLRLYILRCFVCRTISSDMAKKFCNKCGYKTMKRVSYSLEADGTKKIWESKKPINTRGMKYSLPAPQGGKHAINPILCADQRRPQMRPSKRSLQRNDPLNDDYMSRAADTPFLPKEVNSRAAQIGIINEVSKHRGTFYFEKKNPNDPGKNVRNRRRR